MVATGFTLFFKFFARPAVGVATVKTVGGKALTVKGEVLREHHSIASYLMAEYNGEWEYVLRILSCEPLLSLFA